MSTLEVEELRAAFDTDVEALTGTVQVAHVPQDRQFQCDLKRYGINAEETSSIRTTLSVRNDVDRVEASAEGWLKVTYKVGGLKGAQLDKFTDRLRDAIKRQVARKKTYRKYPALQHHSATS